MAEMHDEDKLQAFHDGELAPVERAVMEAHLKSCAECRLALGRWRSLARVLLEPPRVRPSDRFVAAVMKGVDALERPAAERAAWLPGWLVPSFALAASVLVFYLSIPATSASFDSEAALLSDDGTQLAMLAQDQPPKADEVLGLALEPRP